MSPSLAPSVRRTHVGFLSTGSLEEFLRTSARQKNFAEDEPAVPLYPAVPELQGHDKHVKSHNLIKTCPECQKNPRWESEHGSLEEFLRATEVKRIRPFSACVYQVGLAKAVQLGSFYTNEEMIYARYLGYLILRGKDSHMSEPKDSLIQERRQEIRDQVMRKLREQGVDESIVSNITIG